MYVRKTLLFSVWEIKEELSDAVREMHVIILRAKSHHRGTTKCVALS